MIEIGTIIDERYEVLKEIGRGGMSIVYLAMDNRLNKSIVIKDIRKRAHSNDELLLNSLVIEANMLKKLDHWSLPKIYDIIESKDGIYVVMDYIEGESLKEKLKRENVINEKDVIEWGKQLADVLGYLHSRKPNPIIYRDMKPDNIMLTPEGNIKLIDFGIAREYKNESTTDTTNLGTKAYAAPEQQAGKQTDARTDIYSLGVTLYHLVTGKSLSEPPFELRPIRTWNPALSEGLEHIILKCTQSEPENRYQTCEELFYDLENINKLTKGYKKKLTKQLSYFLIPLILTMIFSTTSYIGYAEIKKEQFQDYMRLINDASRYVIDGNDARAIEVLELAISTVDSRRSDAYINLLDLYINRNETDIGISKIESYINDEYGQVHRNDRVLFKLGMTYFDVQNDYSNALKYLQQVDEEEIPQARYYKTLATTMSQMNINYEEFTDYLEEFEAYNDGLPNTREKIDNYHALANIYSSYKAQIQGANTKVIELITKSEEIIDRMDNEEMQYRYEMDFTYKLAQAFHSRATNSEDQESAKEDYEHAIEYYYDLIDLDVANQEEIKTRIGVIYQQMGEETQAIEQFHLVIEEFPNSTGPYVRLMNLLLDIESAKGEEERDYGSVMEIFHVARQLHGAAEDDGLNRVIRRLNNLDLID
ncbi:serine/threonine-protein kinase [Evansella cellulosilytica]|uniref:non-specific serine/threonine protein kinase n=1 Tax=Evansella cellulosilytica (strain ATCC 21833 / DSM 2522 / FERM P-1141 / JCM 9156 / N-4) TaxID=649639 RepID=E6TRH9_EVAC2|nr:serine/threonine-protein kinase [Evansella cellulosilytica]ADU31809.1 serine/threonine protein kinase [Evansella cellulosilytica DSM 2522]